MDSCRMRRMCAGCSTRSPSASIGACRRPTSWAACGSPGSSSRWTTVSSCRARRSPSSFTRTSGRGSIRHACAAFSISAPVRGASRSPAHWLSRRPRWTRSTCRRGRSRSRAATSRGTESVIGCDCCRATFSSPWARGVTTWSCRILHTSATTRCATCRRSTGTSRTSRCEPAHDGLDVVRRILAGAREHLEPSGALFVEVGDSDERLQRAFPALPLTWLEFEHGGGGVFMIRGSEL